MVAKNVPLFNWCIKLFNFFKKSKKENPTEQNNKWIDQNFDPSTGTYFFRKKK